MELTEHRHADKGVPSPLDGEFVGGILTVEFDRYRRFDGLDSLLGT